MLFRSTLDAYAIVPSASSLGVAMSTIEVLRAQGVSVLMHAATAAGRGSMKAQFKKADASGARFALVFGDEEVAAGKVAVKSLRSANGEPSDAAQRLSDLQQASSWAAELRNA